MKVNKARPAEGTQTVADEEGKKFPSSLRKIAASLALTGAFFSPALSRAFMNEREETTTSLVSSGTGINPLLQRFFDNEQNDSRVFIQEQHRTRDTQDQRIWNEGQELQKAAKNAMISAFIGNVSKGIGNTANDSGDVDPHKKGRITNSEKSKPNDKAQSTPRSNTTSKAHLSEPSQTSNSGGSSRIGELKKRDEAVLRLQQTADGGVGPIVGAENRKSITESDPLLAIYGIGTDAEQAVANSEALSKSSGRSVQIIRNQSFKESSDGRIYPSSKLRNIEALVVDGARATFDRNNPPDLALEPATRGLQNEIYRRISNGRSADIVAHSQGSVIAKNAVLEVERMLDREVTEQRLRAEQKTEMMQRIRIVTVGTYASPQNWPKDVIFMPVSDPRDVVAHLGGWQEPTRDRMNMPGVKAHDFIESYVPAAAARMRLLEGK